MVTLSPLTAVESPIREDEAAGGSQTETRGAGIGGGQRLHAPQPVSMEVVRAIDFGVSVAALVGVGSWGGWWVDGGLAATARAPEALLVLCILPMVWQVLCASTGLYEAAVNGNRRLRTVRLLASGALGVAATLAIPLFSSGAWVSVTGLLAFWPAVVGATLLEREALGWLGQVSRTLYPREVIIVGSGARAERLRADIECDPRCGYRVLGFVDTSDGDAPEVRGQLLGRLDQLEQILMRQAADEVLIALPTRSRYKTIEEVIAVCERVGVESKYFADHFGNSIARARYEPAGEIPFVALKVVADDGRLIVKRMLDILGAVAGLILLAPVFAAIALAIKLMTPGPVFFAQERYGLNRRRFRMYKFRTMVHNAEELQAQLEHMNEVGGPVFKIRQDPRITPLGRFLRRTSLDELPQLYNVVRGEMSIVGPRPMALRDVHRFNEAWLMRRFSVKPGLTCLWQISGRNNLGFDEWIRLDLQYIDNWSLALELWIVLRTIPAVFRGTGAM
jgi:exopolysaccharide biosynthesis polyprenyl glycosylphosphotransferase